VTILNCRCYYRHYLRHLLLAILRAGTAGHERVNKSGLKITLWSIKVSVNIMILQKTLVAVFGGSRMDVFGKRVPDGRSGD